MALGGGLVVYLSLLSVVAVVLATSSLFELNFLVDWRDIVGFTLACTTVVLVGLVDDCIGLRGRHKLLGQMVAAGMLMWTGLTVNHVGLFGCDVDLGLLSMPFTLFWLLGAINAINLLDGLDGLATLLGIILTTTISLLAGINGNIGIALIALVLVGSLLGFLRYNLPPARMYLGDAGSMLVGLMVGAMAIRAMLKGPGTVLLAAPLAIWVIPILDSGAAILRRRLTGRSIFATDRGHLHHLLLECLGSNAKVLVVVCFCCLVTCMGGLLSVVAKNDLFAFISCLAVVAMFVVTGMFGRAELRLLLDRLRSVGVSLGDPTNVGGSRVRESKVRLQGNQKWEVLWETLTESADKLNLCRVQLDVNAPALHESYIATWEQKERQDEQRIWHLEIPLSVGEIQVGHLDIRGRRTGSTSLDELAQLLDLLEPFTAGLAAFTQHRDVHEPALTR